MFGALRFWLDRGVDGFRVDVIWLLIKDEALRDNPPNPHFQPEGPEGHSQVVDPWVYQWHDQEWGGLTIDDQVLYEMHVGTFTPEGKWSAAADKLLFLKDLGITAIEMMPVNDFVGRFGWGYDGVDWFAPTRLYGTPDDLRAFVDESHRLGIGIILDVVYNHLGPTGNVLASFSKHYFTDEYENDWGAALNFDGPNARGARDLVISNAAYWIEEFHFDGLRLDATQNINDSSRPHVIAELVRAARLARRRVEKNHHHSRERAATPGSRAPGRGRRLWSRCCLERRSAPFGDGRGHRSQRGLL
jgi:maltooligosyltrehalose trehalohydrolase